MHNIDNSIIGGMCKYSLKSFRIIVHVVNSQDVIHNYSLSIKVIRRIMKKRIFKVIEKAENRDKLSKVFDNVMLTLIILTVISIILESYQTLSDNYGILFRLFELFSIIVFTIEYALRVWTSDLKYPTLKKPKATVKYVFSFMAIIDLFAILPFYLPMLLPFDLRFLRMLRLTRLFRVMKLNRYSKALQLIGKVIKGKKEELVATIFIMLFIIVISSTMIYYLENPVQPEVFPNIVASFWWAIATLTTVGYGDVYPVTGGGKVLASIIAVTGIGLVALPTGILGSGFMEGIQSSKVINCPKCGEKIDVD